MFQSLRIRLTALFVALTIVPLIIAGALITREGFSTLQDQSVDLQENIAQQTAIRLQAFFDERQNELHVLTDV